LTSNRLQKCFDSTSFLRIRNDVLEISVQLTQDSNEWGVVKRRISNLIFRCLNRFFFIHVIHSQDLTKSCSPLLERFPFLRDVSVRIVVLIGNSLKRNDQKNGQTDYTDSSIFGKVQRRIVTFLNGRKRCVRQNHVEMKTCKTLTYKQEVGGSNPPPPILSGGGSFAPPFERYFLPASSLLASCFCFILR